MRMQKNEFAPEAQQSVRVGDSPRTVIRPAGARVGAGGRETASGSPHRKCGQFFVVIAGGSSFGNSLVIVNNKRWGKAILLLVFAFFINFCYYLFGILVVFRDGYRAKVCAIIARLCIVFRGFVTVLARFRSSLLCCYSVVVVLWLFVVILLLKTCEWARVLLTDLRHKVWTRSPATSPTATCSRGRASGGRASTR